MYNTIKSIIGLLSLASTFLLSDVAVSFAQEIEWQNTIGGNSDDHFRSVMQTADGGYVLGGYSASNISGDKTENSNGGYDYWIVKTDEFGSIQWQNTIGGSGHDFLQTISQTIDGGYILGGTSDSDLSGDKTENSNGGYDYWIVKTDSLGNIQWQNTIGGDTADIIISIQQTADKGYILGGWSASNISGDKTEGNLNSLHNTNDYWIVKTDSVGNIQWQNTIGGNDEDRLCSFEQTADGGYIVGGWSYSDSSGDKTEINNGFSDYWIIKTDSIGDIEWQNTIGGNYSETLSSIHQTSDGGYILGGSSDSDLSGDKAEGSNGGSDYWILKTDSSGNILWQKTIGGNFYDGLTSVQQTVGEGYILCGSSWSNISGDKTENSNGNDDYWVMKLDAIGNIQWQNTIGGSDRDETYCIKETADGGYVLGGYSLSNVSGDKSENNVWNSDYWILKLINKHNSITGKTFADLNNNNIKDFGEPPVMNKMVSEQNTGNFSFSQSDGTFVVSVLDSGNFSVYIDTLDNYNAIPSIHNIFFSGIQQSDSLNDFAFQPQAALDDLCVTMTPLGNFRSGFSASYRVNYINNGTTIIVAPTLIFFPSTNAPFLYANIIPTSNNPDSVVWNLPTLYPFQSGSILLTVGVNSGLPLTTVINSFVRIEPIVSDVNPVCNYSETEVYITGSLDPNDIKVSKDTLLTTQLVSPPWLDYIIRFQNTGNDTAFYIRILNSIDTNRLDIYSIEFVNSSHLVNLSWIPWERNMEFKFNSILLPDSSSNEPLSHGFVHYRIKPKSDLLAGDTIRNNAFIYFDFNSPVQTNSAITNIVTPTNLLYNSYPENRGLVLFPNPTKDEITISGYVLQRHQPAQLKIYDVIGNEVYKTDITTLNFKLQTSNFYDGVYFVQLRQSETIMRGKFLKQ